MTDTGGIQSYIRFLPQIEYFKDSNAARKSIETNGNYIDVLSK